MFALHITLYEGFIKMDVSFVKFFTNFGIVLLIFGENMKNTGLGENPNGKSFRSTNIEGSQNDMPSHSEQKSGDKDLVQRIALGEAEAFAAFYDCHASTAFSFLCRLLGNRTEAEDVLQEVFLQAWREVSRYDPTRGSPVAWLIKIARSRGIDRLRQIRLKTQRDGGPIEEWHEQVSTCPSVEAIAMEQDTQGAVHREIDKLPFEQREAITLAFFGGLTHHEIAKRLATPLGTIKTRIRLGMQKLQEAIQKTGVCA